MTLALALVVANVGGVSAGLLSKVSPGNAKPPCL